MAHDRNGSKLREGDLVSLMFRVRHAAAEEEGPNVVIETVELLYPGETPSSLILNGKQIEKVFDPLGGIDAATLAFRANFRLEEHMKTLLTPPPVPASEAGLAELPPEPQESESETEKQESESDPKEAEKWYPAPDDDANQQSESEKQESD